MRTFGADVAGMTLNLFIEYPWILPSHTDSGLGHVTCSGQWDNSKCDTETYKVLVGLVCLPSLAALWNPNTSCEEAQAGLP